MEIVNKVAQSGLISFDLSNYYHKGERVVYDIKDNLFQGLILREKDFRDFIKGHDWAQYEGKNVAIVCSVDAIVPTWAFMLLATKLEPFVNMLVFGDLNMLEDALFRQALAKVDLSEYKDQRIVMWRYSSSYFSLCRNYSSVQTNRQKYYVRRTMFYRSFV